MEYKKQSTETYGIKHELYKRKNCPYCGGSDFDYREVIFSNGQKNIGVVCMYCERKLGYVKYVKDSDFRMPYGKYKGKLLTKIKEFDINYLKWLHENSSGSLNDRVEKILYGLNLD